MVDPIARLLVDDFAVKLATFPRQVILESGCSASLAAGLAAAIEAFHEHVGENEIAILRDTLFNDIETGLRDLDLEGPTRAR